MRKTMIFLACLLATAAVEAARRTTQDMQDIARQQLAKGAAAARGAEGSLELKRVMNKPTLSVYSDGSQFVVVSRDDRFQPVLAYGAGNGDFSQAPDNVRWWLQTAQEAMERGIKDGVAPTRRAAHAVVEPMLSTYWGQDAPFNNYAPLFKKDKTKAPAGCVATAMAQVMNHHHYPASAHFTGSYSVSDEQEETIVEVDNTYDWTFQDAYGYYYPLGSDERARQNYAPSKGNKVATLLRDCAYSVRMNFNPSGSGASSFNVAQAYRDCFQYPAESVKFYYRYFYSDEEWMDLIASELQAGCPVYASGSSSESGGHAFVFHGMDENGLVCVNWGWNGYYDGYYDVALLNPGDDHFEEGQALVTGIRPEALATDHVRSLLGTARPYSFGYDNETGRFDISLNAAIYNYTETDLVGRWAIVIEDVENKDSVWYWDLWEPGDTIPSFAGFGAQTVSDTIMFDPGHYRIYMATKDTLETEWQPVRTVGGPFYYDLVVAADSTVTIGEEPVFTLGIDRIVFDAPLVGRRYATQTYDLQGRPVATPRRGLYVKDGRKILY